MLLEFLNEIKGQREMVVVLVVPVVEAFKDIQGFL
jgi:hypothetical protein